MHFYPEPGALRKCPKAIIESFFDYPQCDAGYPHLNAVIHRLIHKLSTGIIYTGLSGHNDRMLSPPPAHRAPGWIRTAPGGRPCTSIRTAAGSWTVVGHSPTPALRSPRVTVTDSSTAADLAIQHLAERPACPSAARYRQPTTCRGRPAGSASGRRPARSYGPS